MQDAVQEFPSETSGTEELTGQYLRRLVAGNERQRFATDGDDVLFGGFLPRKNKGDRILQGHLISYFGRLVYTLDVLFIFIFMRNFSSDHIP